MDPPSPNRKLTVYEFIMSSTREDEPVDDSNSPERKEHHRASLAMLISGSTAQSTQTPTPTNLSLQTQAAPTNQPQPFANRHSIQTPQLDISTQQGQSSSIDQAQPTASIQNNPVASQTPFLDQFTTTFIGPLTVHSSQHTRLGRIVIHQDQTGRIPIAGFQEIYARTYPATEVMINTGRTSGPRLYYIVFLDPADEGPRFRVLWAMADQSTMVRMNGRMVWIVVLERVEEGFVVDEVTRGRRTQGRTEG